MATGEKSVTVVGIDDNQHSFHALQWTLDHFFTPSPAVSPSRLVIVHAKPTPSAIDLAVPGAADVLPNVDAVLKKKAARVLKKAKRICSAQSVNDVAVKAVEGDAGKVLCEAVEEHRASKLVLGSHGYGAIERDALGSVGDYCARHARDHHAHCTVMIVNEQNQSRWL